MAFGPARLHSAFGSMRTHELLREVRDAFAEVRRPAHTMADAEVADDRNEASRFAEHDSHWWEIPDPLLDRCSAPFCFLSAQDFIYYLPAYMTWLVRAEGESSHVSGEWLIYYLEDAQRSAPLAGLLSPQQASAVRHFLDWVLANDRLRWVHEHAIGALRGAWKQENWAEPGAPPNGGPGTRSGDPGATDGPPSGT